MNINAKTILLVEDEAIIAMDARLQLEDAGYRVVCAPSGESAVTIACRANPPIDLVLMDINLGPGMDGTEAATKILEKRDIPIIFRSSHTEKAIVAKTEEISSYGYVVKNSGITVLDASVKMAFRLHEAKKDLEHRNLTVEETNRELQHRNDLIDYIISFDPSSIAVFDRDMKYRFVSDRFINDYRLEWKYLIGRSHYEIFPDIPDRVKEIHRRAMNGECLRCENDEFLRSDGTIDHVRWECRPWYGSDFTIQGIILYSEVITDRVTAEQELARVKEQHGALVSELRSLRNDNTEVTRKAGVTG